MNVSPYISCLCIIEMTLSAKTSPETMRFPVNSISDIIQSMNYCEYVVSKYTNHRTWKNGDATAKLNHKYPWIILTKATENTQNQNDSNIFSIFIDHSITITASIWTISLR